MTSEKNHPFLVGGSATKEQIISVLGDKWPQSGKEIKNELKRIYSNESTYQAVHKALSDLEKQRVLRKEDKKYLLNVDWIRSVKDFAESLEFSYVKGPPTGTNEKTFSLNFDTIYGAYKYMLTELERFAKSEERPKVIAMRMWYYWWAHSITPFEYMQFLKAGGNNDIFLLGGHDTKADRYVEAFYKSICRNLYSKRGVEGIGKDCDLYSMGETLYQIYYSKDARQWISDFYESSKGVTGMLASQFYNNYFKRKTGMKILVTKNAELAEHIRRENIAYFKNPKFMDKEYEVSLKL